MFDGTLTTMQRLCCIIGFLRVLCFAVPAGPLALPSNTMHLFQSSRGDIQLEFFFSLPATHLGTASPDTLQSGLRIVAEKKKPKKKRWDDGQLVQYILNFTQRI